jgi:hypothetical protein
MTASDNLPNYVAAHTTCTESRWHGVGSDLRGPYPISAVRLNHDGMEIMPEKGKFLELVRAHQGDIGCNPLDGHEHGFLEMARWLHSSGTVLPFVGLGVILGVFELVNPWRNDASYEEQVSFYQEQAGGLFKSRPNQ